MFLIQAPMIKRDMYTAGLRDEFGSWNEREREPLRYRYRVFQTMVVY
jgi:hypothetical protein